MGSSGYGKLFQGNLEKKQLGNAAVEETKVAVYSELHKTT